MFSEQGDRITAAELDLRDRNANWLSVDGYTSALAS